MGWFSFWRQDTVEQVLEKLETRITTLEDKQKSSYYNQRKIISSLVYYAIIIEVVLVVWFYVHKKPPALIDKLLHASPLFLFPLLISILRYAISFYYSRRIVINEANLEKLRSQLKTKLEERKKATDFENTQKLLSKYEKMAQSKTPVESAKEPTTPRSATNPPSTTPTKREENTNTNPSTPIPPAQQSTLLPPSSTLRHRPVQSNAQEQQQPEQKRSRASSLKKQPSWMDRLVDYLVGAGPQYGFALICEKCSAHNGLAPPSELGSIQFRCRACNHFNQFKQPEQAQREGEGEAVANPQSQQAQQQQDGLSTRPRSSSFTSPAPPIPAASSSSPARRRSSSSSSPVKVILPSQPANVAT